MWIVSQGIMLLIHLLIPLIVEGVIHGIVTLTPWWPHLSTRVTVIIWWNGRWPIIMKSISGFEVSGIAKTITLAKLSVRMFRRTISCGSHILCCLLYTSEFHTNTDSKYASTCTKFRMSHSVGVCNRGGLRHSQPTHGAPWVFPLNGRYEILCTSDLTLACLWTVNSEFVSSVAMCSDL